MLRVRLGEGGFAGGMGIYHGLVQLETERDFGPRRFTIRIPCYSVNCMTASRAWRISGSREASKPSSGVPGYATSLCGEAIFTLFRDGDDDT